MSDKQISAALVKAQKAFGPALKSNTNPHFKSKYADLSACVEAVIDSLNANGIALIQKQHPHDGGVMVETIFLNESGEQFSAGMLSVPAAKQDPQGYGSALTYARRYSLMAACGIAPEDDDGNAASRKQGGGPTDGATDTLTAAQREYVSSVAATIGQKMGADNTWGAYEELVSAIERVKKNRGDANMFEVSLYKALPAQTRAALDAMKADERKRAD